VSEMIERAAKAYAAEFNEWSLRVNKGEPEPHEICRNNVPGVSDATVVRSYPNYPRALQVFGELRANASMRAALFAALDPEDEALVERVARELCGVNGCDPDQTDYKGRKLWTDCDWPEAARAAIAALRALPQEPALSTQDGAGEVSSRGDKT